MSEPKCRYCGKTRCKCRCLMGPCMTKNHEILRIALAIRGQVATYQGWLYRTDFHPAYVDPFHDIMNGYMCTIYAMAHGIAQLAGKEET